jgi:hypothetical protein
MISRVNDLRSDRARKDGACHYYPEFPGRHARPSFLAALAIWSGAGQRSPFKTTTGFELPLGAFDDAIRCNPL